MLSEILQLSRGFIVFESELASIVEIAQPAAQQRNQGIGLHQMDFVWCVDRRQGW